MRRLMIAVAVLAAMSACGSPAASGREVASLSTAATDDSTSGTGDVTGTTAPTDPAEAALQFAKCMREHGIDMPDPVTQEGDGGSGGGVMINVGGGDGAPKIDPKDMEAANKECEHFMKDAAASFDPPSPEDLEKMKEQALAFSKCMREHGIDMPDPQFGDNGTFTVGLAVGPDNSSNSGPPPVDFNSKDFQAASEACGQNGGFGFTTGTVPG